MNNYNGFAAETRVRSIHGQRRLFALGRPRPEFCLACGLGGDVCDVAGHWETYFEPWRVNKDYPLCAICHLWVHCRFKDPAGFSRYAASVAVGHTVVRSIESIARGYAEFRSRFLEGKEVATGIGAEAANRLILFEIARGETYREALDHAREEIRKEFLIPAEFAVPPVDPAQWFDPADHLRATA